MIAKFGINFGVWVLLGAGCMCLFSNSALESKEKEKKTHAPSRTQTPASVLLFYFLLVLEQDLIHGSNN